ncbi:hypothetical protein Scep_009625 [Stephania cephalantha]|uniref:Uncharacterized protein n=1 Tax=Stephania cephalantha TaxID=152367 RepID=A0AAP0PEI2_9MAGN
MDCGESGDGEKINSSIKGEDGNEDGKESIPLRISKVMAGSSSDKGKRKFSDCL